MPQEIRRFFAQYRDAFNALDGEAVAKLRGGSLTLTWKREE